MFEAISFMHPIFLLYRKYCVKIKHERDDSYRAKSPAGQDAHLAE